MLMAYCEKLYDLPELISLDYHNINLFFRR